MNRLELLLTTGLLAASCGNKNLSVDYTPLNKAKDGCELLYNQQNFSFRCGEVEYNKNSGTPKVTRKYDLLSQQSRRVEEYLFEKNSRLYSFIVETDDQTSVPLGVRLTTERSVIYVKFDQGKPSLVSRMPKGQDDLYLSF